MFSLSEANEYFEMHLKFELWDSLSDDTKSAALNMAMQDVKNFIQLDELDETCIFSYCALFEQAVYLVEFFDILTDPKSLTQESVTGIGSRSYKDKPMPNIAPRAMQFLERIRPPAVMSRG